MFSFLVVRPLLRRTLLFENWEIHNRLDGLWTGSTNFVSTTAMYTAHPSVPQPPSVATMLLSISADGDVKLSCACCSTGISDTTAAATKE